MAERTDRVRRDIEQKRVELETTLEAIGDRVAPKRAVRRAKWKAEDKVDDVRDRVSPARLARRGTDAVLHRLHDVRLSVMGSDDEGDDDVTYGNGSARRRIGGSGRGLEEATPEGRGRASELTRRAGDAAGTVADQARSGPEVMARSAKGNPLAAGMVVFGGAFLIASRLRPTERERSLASRAKERLEPVEHQALETGRTMADEIKGVAQERPGEVRRRATEAAEAVKETATSSAEQVQQEAASSAGQLKDKAASSAGQVKEEAAGAGKRVKRTSRAASQRVKGQAQGAAAEAGGKAPSRRGTGRARP
ncbi:MAG: DUF3618 domain-containing protein, partial [Acidimicrobiales bacterium]